VVVRMSCASHNANGINIRAMRHTETWKELEGKLEWQEHCKSHANLALRSLLRHSNRYSYVPTKFFSNAAELPVTR
jgi:hypothetical protein